MRFSLTYSLPRNSVYLVSEQQASSRAGQSKRTAVGMFPGAQEQRELLCVPATEEPTPKSQSSTSSFSGRLLHSRGTMQHWFCIALLAQCQCL